MSLLFADIFEAVRYLRLCKGTSEKDILNYVQERVGGCLSVRNAPEKNKQMTKSDSKYLYLDSRYFKIPNCRTTRKMFNYCHPVLEVIEAIEKLQETKGTTNQQVCDFIRKRGKNPNDPMKVLKTISTLNKLVEEGVLIKKGRRYLFPTKPPESQEDDEEDEEGEEREEEEDENDDDDDCEEYDDNDMMTEDCDQLNDAGEDENNENANDDEEDDDDDEEEDEEEDDDDDDDDDECGEKEIVPPREAEKRSDPSVAETEVEQVRSKNQSILNPTKKNGSGSGKVNESIDSGISSGINVAGNAKEEGSKKSGSKAKNATEAKSNGNTKVGERLAFCTRDFIDSIYRPKHYDIKPQDSLEHQQGKPQDVTIIDESPDELGTIYTARKRESRCKKSRLKSSNYRSRSPVQASRGALYHNLKLNDSDAIRLGAVNSQMLQELADGEMEVDLEKETEVSGIDFDIFRHKSSTNETGGTGAKDPFCSDHGIKLQEDIKMEPVCEGEVQHALKTQFDSRVSLAKGKDRKPGDKAKDRQKRDSSADDENAVKDEAYASLCSVCDKKKRLS